MKRLASWPAWANWITVDANGITTVFKKKPYISKYAKMWWSDTREWNYVARQAFPRFLWRFSLRRITGPRK